MARSRPPSNRFLPQPESPLPKLRNPWGPQEVFAEGQWQSIRVSLERQGWSSSQIERVHDQLRQGWPLLVAKQNVASFTRHCPVRSRLSEG
ncbi:MAG: hypothetical protein VKN83_04920 [Cyanobacteriota bacterium]|nr:hypothetical protein [Cyanobacteriota bacterium]